MLDAKVVSLTHNYKRHGIKTLFAAVELVKYALIAECTPRHRHQECVPSS